MLFIFTAMYPEAAPIITRLGLRPVNDERVFRIFRSEDIILTVTGMGKVTAAASVSHIISRYGTGSDRILNAGICACPDESVKSRIFLVNKLTDHDTGRDFYPDMLYDTGLPEKADVTFSRLVKSEDMEGSDSLFEMEASAVFETASIYTGPEAIVFLKIVSDAGDVSGLTAPVVQSLVERNLDDICKVVDLLLEQKKQITEPDEDLLKLAEELKCSEYMKNRLFEVAGYLRSEGKDIRNYISHDLPVRDKKEGNEVINEILSHLY